MGITTHSLTLIESTLMYAKENNVKIDSVMELGSQNLYADQYPGNPYGSVYYQGKGIKYNCIDLNGENNAIKIDLEKPLPEFSTSQELNIKYNLLTDFGTSEHIRDAYVINKTIYDLTEPDGYIIRENPKTGNWKDHGFNYVTMDFYRKLCSANNLKIILLSEHPAVGNITDGWNVCCVMKKNSNSPFVSR